MNLDLARETIRIAEGLRILASSGENVLSSTQYRCFRESLTRSFSDDVCREIDAWVRGLRGESLWVRVVQRLASVIGDEDHTRMPSKMLLGWRDILVRIDQPDDKWDFIRRLSKKTGGPIRVVRGGKAKSDDAELVKWWRRVVADRAKETEKPELGIHTIGRRGLNAAEISGSVKKKVN